MKVEMTREKALKLTQLSKELLDPRFGSLHPKFAYAVSKNYNAYLVPERDNFQVATDKDADWQAREKKRLELARELCQKDAEGNPVVVAEGQFIVPDQIAFNTRLSVIDKEYAEAINHREVGLKEVLTFDMHTIKLSHVPEKMAGPITLYMNDFIVDDEVEDK